MDKARMVSAFTRLKRKSEISHLRDRISGGAQILGYSLLLSHSCFLPYAYAGPTGGNIVGGSGNISQSGVTTTINQASSRLAIDWASYNINSDEIVNYLQPSSSSIALNRILGTNASQIHGQINANGQVILVNPNGIFFSPTASINVGSLIASGLTMNPSDFMNGQFIFNEVLGADGAVINSGTINASLGGSVTLLGKRVENNGLISAQLGAVNLAAGKEAVVTFDSNGLIGIKVTKAILQDELGIDPAVLNSGQINAEGGRILITGSVSADIFSQAVNTGDIEQATSVVANADGSFSLGAGADVVNTGSIDVSTENGNAGQIVLLGENVSSSGNISADTVQGNGGSIELHANDITSLTDDSVTSARAETGGKGGTIKVLGDKVGLFDRATVDVSGANGGGTALIGGDRQGKNPFIRNASFVFLDNNARVLADALKDGNGGKIITFAQDTARIYGGLFARGGVINGNGGFIETSGLKAFEITQAPDVSAYFGAGGEWLIDPNNITIAAAGSGATNISGTNPFDTSDDGAILGVDLIVNALTGGADVTITTGSAGTNAELGNILFTASLDYTGTLNNTLTLTADNNIVFGNTISISNGNTAGDSLNVNLYAGGSVILNNGALIDTQGGNFTVGDTTNAIIPTSFTNSGTITTEGTTSQAAGDITITTSGNITSTGFNARGGGGSQSPSNTIGQNGGNITLSGGGAITVGNINTSGSFGNDGGSGPGFTGGTGGNVSIVSTSTNVADVVSVGAIVTSGGNGDGNGGNPANGGNAGTINIEGASVLLNGDLTANGGAGEFGGINGNGAGITITGPARLAAALTAINSLGNSNGNISFTGNITGTTARTESLAISGNNINFGGDIGNAVRLADVSLDATGSVDATGHNITSGTFTVSQSTGFVAANIDTQGASNGDVAISSTGAVSTGSINTSAGTTGNGGNVDLSGTDITVGAITALGGSSSGSAGTVIVTATDNGGTPSITLNGDINAAASSLSLNGTGATGTMTINHTGNFTSAISVTGSAGTDTIVSANRINNWTIDNANNGSLNGNLTFNNIENLIGNANTDTFTLSTTSSSLTGAIDGGAGTNTLTGRNSTTTWTVSSADAGTMDDVNSFTNIGNLVGGTNTDTFILDGTGSLTGTINGGGSTNSLTNRNTANTWSITAANSGTVTNTGGFSNIQNLTGGTSTDDFVLSGTGSIAGNVDGGGGVNSLTARDVVNNWSITDSDQGSVDNVAGFQNIANLIGGTSTDNFTLTSNTSAVTGSIDGGAGINTLTGRDTATTWTVSTANAGTSDNVASFSNIASLVGGSNDDDFILNGTGSLTGTVNGGGGNNSLTGRDVVNTWTVTSADAGTVTNTAGFSNIGSLIGGSNTDTFTLSGTGDLSGSINGGTGTNSLTARDVANTWDITTANGGSVTNITNGFSNIQNLTGGSISDDFTLSGTGSVTGTINGAGGVNSLTARDVANTWIISAANTGTVTNTGGFLNIGTLTGGSNTDNFTLTGTGSLSGLLDGAGGTNSLTARDTANTWSISGTNAGTVTNTNDFQNIQNITGGAGVDTITYSTTSADIQGLIDGGAGIDSINLTVFSATDITVELGNGTSASPNPVVVNVDNIEDITANSSASVSNEIVGDNIQNSWTINEVNGGQVAPTLGATAENTVAFHNFANIVGGSNDDTFAVVAGGSATSIDGGNQVVADIVDYSSQLTPLVVDLGTGLSNTITGLEGAIGNGTDSTIIGDNTANTWNITGSNTGTIGNLTFVDFTLIQGNDDVDVLNVNLTGTENGSISFDGGNNSDTVNFIGGNASYAGQYNPDVTVNALQYDQLAYTNGANTYTVNYRNTETVNDNLQAASLNVNGTAAAETITIGSDTNAADTTFQVGTNALVHFSNKATTVILGAPTDTINIGNDVDLTGQSLRLAGGTLINGSNSLITANSLAIDSVANDMTGNRLRTDVNDLALLNTTGLINVDEQNTVNLSQVGPASTLNLNAGSDVTSGNIITSGNLNITSANGNITLNNAGNNLTGQLSLSAANGNINLRNSAATNIASINSVDLTINSTGAITDTGTVTSTGNTVLTSAGNIVLDSANNFNTLTVTSANNVTINDTSSLEVTSISANGQVTTTSNGLVLGTVDAASVSLNAGTGDITDSNGSANNITASQVTLRATTGIGSADALETSTADLDVINSTSGNVNINNTGAVTLTNLVNNGNITFNNDQTVTLDNVDAGFTVGRFTMDVANGSVYGINRSPQDFTQIPDITADSAFITVANEFGTIDRPIVLQLNSELFLDATFSSTFFFGPEPPLVNNVSDLQVSVFDSINTVSGQKLVEVESIADIDPAIFTAIRNYNYDDISILLPRDQLYEDELDRLEQ